MGNVEFASHITKTTLRNSASGTSMTYKSEIGYPTNARPSKQDQQLDESTTAVLMKTLSKTTNLVTSKMMTETMSKVDLSTKLKENNNPIGEQKPKTTIQNLLTSNIVSGTVVSKIVTQEKTIGSNNDIKIENTPHSSKELQTYKLEDSSDKDKNSMSLQKTTEIKNYESLNKGPPTMLQSFPTTVKSVNLVSENSQLSNEITDSEKTSKKISKQTNFKTDSSNTETLSTYKATAFLQSKSTELDTNVGKTEMSPLSNTRWIEKEMNTVSQGQEKTLLDISQSSRYSLEASKNGQNIKKTTSSFDVENDIKELSKTTLDIHLSSDAKTQLENGNTESRKKSTDSQKTSKIDLNESQTIIKYDHSNLESPKDLEEADWRTKGTFIMLSTENVNSMADDNLKMTLNAVPDDTTSFKGTKRTITKQNKMYTPPPETIKSTNEDLNGQLEVSNHMKIGTKIMNTLETF